MLNPKDKTRSQKGAIGGVPEQVIAMAIGVLILVGTIAMGTRAMENYRAQQDINDMSSIIRRTKELYQALPPGTLSSSYITDKLIAQGIIPGSMVVDATHAKSHAGGDFTAQLSTSPSGDWIHFRYASYPKAACIKFMMSTPDYVETVGVNSSGHLRGGSGSCDSYKSSVPGPITYDLAACGCNQTSNNMRWSIRP